MKKSDQEEEKSKDANLQETNGYFRGDDDAEEQISLHHKKLVQTQSDDHEGEYGYCGQQQPEPLDFVKIPEYPTEDFGNGQEGKDRIKRLCRPVDVVVGHLVITKREAHHFGRQGVDCVVEEPAQLTEQT